jgi:hypothetical protein
MLTICSGFTLVKKTLKVFKRCLQFVLVLPWSKRILKFLRAVSIWYNCGYIYYYQPLNLYYYEKRIGSDSCNSGLYGLDNA